MNAVDLLRRCIPVIQGEIVTLRGMHCITAMQDAQRLLADVEKYLGVDFGEEQP